MYCMSTLGKKRETFVVNKMIIHDKFPSEQFLIDMNTAAEWGGLTYDVRQSSKYKLAFYPHYGDVSHQA